MDAPEPFSAAEPASPGPEAHHAGSAAQIGSYALRERLRDLAFLAASAAGFALVAYDRWGAGLLG